MVCNVYHATRKSNYDSIMKEGLKPICDKSKKTIASCKNALYFNTDLEKVAELSFMNIKLNDTLYEDSKLDPRNGDEIDFIIFEVPIQKVFENCSTLQEEDSHILAYSGDDTYGNKRDCIIKSKDMKIVYDSTGKWGYAKEEK